MNSDPQLLRELLDVTGAATNKGVSPYRGMEGKTCEQSQDFGRRCMGEGDYEGAVSHFRRALDQTDGDRHEALLELGAAYESAGMSPQAYQQFKKAARIRETGEVARGIGHLLASYGKNSDALNELQRAVELEPGNAYNQFRLAELLRKMGRPTLALEAISSAASLASDDAFYHYWMGDLLLEIGRFDDAVASFAAAVDHSPGDSRLCQLAGLALWGAGKKAEAIRAIRLASDLGSEDRVNYGILQAFFRLNGQELESLQESKRAAEMDSCDRAELERKLALAGIATV